MLRPRVSDYGTRWVWRVCVMWVACSAATIASGRVQVVLLRSHRRDTRHSWRGRVSVVLQTMGSLYANEFKGERRREKGRDMAKGRGSAN